MPASANAAATSAEDTSVPPPSTQPPLEVSYEATGLLVGSATAATSLSVRVEHPVSACQEGLASYGEHPDPLPLQAVSVHPRAAPLSAVSVVPPTAITSGDAAG